MKIRSGNIASEDNIHILVYIRTIVSERMVDNVTVSNIYTYNVHRTFTHSQLQYRIQ